MALLKSLHDLDSSHEQEFEEPSESPEVKVNDQLEPIDISDEQNGAQLEHSRHSSQPTTQSLVPRAVKIFNTGIVGVTSRSQKHEIDMSRSEKSQPRTGRWTNLKGREREAGSSERSKTRPEERKPAREVNALIEQLRQRDMQLQQLEVDLENTKKANETLVEDLEECKAQIFRMQPMDIASDTDISRQYEEFCRIVQTWADNQFGLAEGVPLNLHVAITGSFPSPKIVPKYLRKRELDVIEKSASSRATMARYLVHHHLFERVFNRDDFHKCLEEWSGTFLERIAVSMRALTPRRDTETLKTWKAEAMRVLAADPDLNSKRVQEIRDIAKELEKVLQPLLLRKTDYRWDEDGCIGMVERAVSFEASIDYSPKTYVVEKDFLTSEPETKRALQTKDLESSTIVDVETDSIIRSQI